MAEDIIFAELSKLQFESKQKYLTPVILDYYTLAAEQPKKNGFEILEQLKEKYKVV